MKIYVKDENDRSIVRNTLSSVGFDIFNKIECIISDIEYNSIYEYVTHILVELSEDELLREHMYILTPLAPSNNHYLKQSRWGGQYTPATTSKFQKMLKNRLLLHKDNWIKPNSQKYVNTDFTFWFEGDSRDANNYFKVSLDVCEDYLYANDKRTIPNTKNVFIYNGVKLQLMETYISDKIGVFDNLDHLQGFIKDNCHKCHRNTYKRKCGEFYKLLENRISTGGQDGINSCIYKVKK